MSSCRGCLFRQLAKMKLRQTQFDAMHSSGRLFHKKKKIFLLLKRQNFSPSPKRIAQPLKILWEEMISMVLTWFALTSLISPNFEIKEVIYYATILSEDLIVLYLMLHLHYYYILFCDFFYRINYLLKAK